MNKNPQNNGISCLSLLDISDEDILEAMKDVHGYLDITPGDVKELYRLAYTHAVERLTHFVKARDVMTKTVVFVKRETPLREVAELMTIHFISGVPVVENGGKIAGIISEKDFLRRMDGEDTISFMSVVALCLKKGCVALSMREQKAEDIMTSPVITVGENTPISEIADIFTKQNINRVPVTDQKDNLIGIVSRADIIRSSFPKIVN
ncbi:MAG: CBS domain-containing protein [Desulfobacterales bacterium]|nr:CBS domain-containing protein [Desulfobacterales bacterium]